MNQLERSNFTLENTPYVGKGFIDSELLLERYRSFGDVPCLRVLQKDLAYLEDRGAIICVGTEGRRRRYAKPRPVAQLPTELAYVLSQCKGKVQALLPTDVYDSLSEYFDSAEQVLQKLHKNQSQDRLCRYMKAINDIDLSRHMHSQSVAVLNAIKNAMFNGLELELTMSGSGAAQYLSPSRIQELDGSLYLRGQALESRQTQAIKVSDIAAARAGEFSTFRTAPRLRAAA